MKASDAKLIEKYGQNLRIAFKQFPLTMHPNAQLAAEASLCAKAQGRFWEMHDLLFSNQKALDLRTINRYASEIGLNLSNFQNCLLNHDSRPIVETEIEEARKLGVPVTPTIFVNGRYIETPSFEQLCEAIQEELEQGVAKGGQIGTGPATANCEACEAK